MFAPGAGPPYSSCYSHSDWPYVRSLDDSGSETGQGWADIAERKWRQYGLTVHGEIYAKQLNLVSDLISKAKEDYICETKI